MLDIVLYILNADSYRNISDNIFYSTRVNLKNVLTVMWVDILLRPFRPSESLACWERIISTALAVLWWQCCRNYLDQLPLQTLNNNFTDKKTSIVGEVYHVHEDISKKTVFSKIPRFSSRDGSAHCGLSS